MAGAGGLALLDWSNNLFRSSAAPSTMTTSRSVLWLDRSARNRDQIPAPSRPPHSPRLRLNLESNGAFSSRPLPWAAQQSDLLRLDRIELADGADLLCGLGTELVKRSR